MYKQSSRSIDPVFQYEYTANIYLLCNSKSIGIINTYQPINCMVTKHFHQNDMLWDIAICHWSKNILISLIEYV